MERVTAILCQNRAVWKYWVRPLVALALVNGALLARESICLNTGFCLTATSHSQLNGVYIVRTGSGSMEFPAGQIAEITILPDLPETAAAPLKATSGKSASVNEILVREAIKQGLEPEFVRSVARIESNLRQDAISNKGAIGLMQLMPGTAAILGVNAHVPEENVQGGTKFLRELLLKYNGDAALALAAYNAGPGAVQKYNGIPPYLETRQYIVRVLSEYKKMHAATVVK